jgi:hypothetical protein
MSLDSMSNVALLQLGDVLEDDLVWYQTFDLKSCKGNSHLLLVQPAVKD